MRICRSKLFVSVGLALALAALVVGQPPSGKTITVCPSGCQFAKIQDAINAAQSGDTIQIHEGTYFEHLEITKSVTVKGIAADRVTLVSGGAGRPLITIWGSELIEVLVEGLTTNGGGSCNYIENPTGFAELGVVVKGQSRALLQNNRILNHGWCSGVVADDSTEVTLQNNLISGNSWGVVVFRSAIVRMVNNEILKNQSIGVQVGSSRREGVSKVFIQNNRISKNGEGITIVTNSEVEISGNEVLGSTSGWGVALSISSCYGGNPNLPSELQAKVTGGNNRIPDKNEPNGNKRGDVCPDSLKFLKNK